MKLLNLLYDIKIPQLLDNIVIKNRKFNINDTILIVGSPRSGTSWLMEILGNIPGYTYTFEPFNPIWCSNPQRWGFQNRLYIPDDRDWLEVENYLTDIFNGNLVGFQHIYQTKPRYLINLFFAKKLIVKSIRVTRLLPWLVKRFDLANIYYVIRHPCAVISSQIKTGFCGYHDALPPYKNIFPDLKYVLEEASKINGLDHNFLNKIKNIKSLEEILAVVWCIDNYVPLSISKPYPWKVVIYERLVKDGKNEITRIFNEIKIKNIPSTTFQSLKTPSKLTPTEDLKQVTKVDKQLFKWKKSLSNRQIENIQRIISGFGFDFYTMDSEPTYEEIGF